MENFVPGSKCRKCSVQNFVPEVDTGSVVYKIVYQAVDTGSAVYKILCTALPAFTAWYFCTLHVITYPDVVYKVATATILIQTRGIQSVLILEKEVVI